MAANPIDIYRRQIERELQAGNATEHTHRPALKDLIEALQLGVTATNEPKRVECGAPDFIVSRKSVHGPMTLGYIEAKDVGKDLGEIEHSDQIKRYRSALPNLVLTDYLEFRWYVAGEHRQTVRLARVGKGGKLVPEKGGPESVREVLAAFLAHQAPSINTPKELALRMARLTHLIRDIIQAAFEKEQASATVRDLHKAFEKVLIPELPIPQFADMFSQTLAYGLFAARMNHRGPRGSFKRLGAAAEIPKTNPFLRQLFETITGAALDDEPFVGFVDDLAQLLADTDIDAVLADFGKRTARQDPVVHFYETFLAAYDPKLREARGVYYTPEPVVSYIVRSVDGLLKNRFGCAGGLADTTTVEYEREQQVKGKAGKVKVTSPRVLILDPACGTGTFLYSVVDHIRAEFVKQGNAGMWSGYVRNHLLPRLFGFELLMAPYAVAHFKLGMQLAGYDLDPAQREKWAYDFSGDERLGVFLINTLEEAEIRAETLFGPLRVISQEANAAAKIKRELPIMVVMGNPPYSNFGRMNRSEWILNLLDEYKKGLREKKLNLDDDFIKFIRFAQWRIDSTGGGILAFISNNTYIDGLTHRRMRQSLMRSFSEIFILDLHGSSKKKEKSPDGSKDENVFDIQQGVAIGIFVKKPRKTDRVSIHHGEIWGSREKKYTVLFETDLAETAWKEVKPVAPHFFFVPKDFRNQGEYKEAWGVGDIFSVWQNGLKTDRDDLFFDFDRGTLKERTETLFSLECGEDFKLKYRIVASSSFDIEGRLKQTAFSAVNIKRCLYRPFDLRWLYYDPKLTSRPAEKVMRHMLAGQNVCLICLRQTRRAETGTFMIASGLVNKDAVSLFDIATVFPLYLFSNHNGAQAALLKTGGQKPNLNPPFIEHLEKRLELSFVSEGRGDLKKSFGPEDVFNYIYAVFHSPTYRTRYAEFLKSDFPRVPLTSNLELFRSLCGFGGELVALHLLESPVLKKPIARFPVKGPNLIEKGFPKYVAPGEPEPGTGKPVKEGRVYINKGDATVAAVSDRRHDYGVRELAPALESGGKPPHSKTAAHRAALQRAKPGDEDIGATIGQYFDGVPPEVWNFHIGGYQVCEKWLKDRRGRTLTYDDLEHYRKVVTAINETIRLMAAIEAGIPKWPME